MSNVVLNHALSWLLKALIGSVNWDKVRQAVMTLADSHLEGSLKRKRVLELLRDEVTEIPNRLLNLAIEAAVVQLKGAGK